MKLIGLPNAVKELEPPFVGINTSNEGEKTIKGIGDL